jgi:hypothetical protein
MQRIAVGLAALFAASFFTPAMAESTTEEIQDDDQPGSEIELDIGGVGGAEIERKNGKPLFSFGGEATEQEAEEDPLDDPDNPTDIDPIDEELPGEGPEDLSGPDDMDSLPE